ncbi:c-type cytochrome [Glaciimonas sp. CA11.2]|uniref:c-type cytochrome n=1 Tax=Glaciimonas sp. CA11.2 TaxID=3048601 RepID=UPI002AB58297|nr:c-type cytochrome [Glaciimonas sp. CA11.2]MDY7546013.1 c-type cytochrome [Glaciimonas sp. CA11.2]MEB0163318.1 c-type cytochrome [Glaciimonas sp. CA11.2]
MSDAHNEEQSAIKTPKQLIIAILAGFLVPIICIVLLVEFVTNAQKTGAGSEGQTPEAIATRLKPVADEGFTFKDVNAPRIFLTGEEVYKSTCVACHGSGAAGAPKFGDVSAWGPRLADGEDKVIGYAINGLRAMPAKGGNPDLDDVEVARAVVFMVNASGGKFKDPVVPAPAAAAASGSASASAVAAPVAASASAK